MDGTGELIWGPAPAPEGPLACTLAGDELTGRLAELRDGLHRHLRALERPGPGRLRLVLAGEAGVGAVRDLLEREQGCCAFLAFAIRPGPDRVVVDLEVPEAAAAMLDGLAGLAAPEAVR